MIQHPIRLFGVCLMTLAMSAVAQTPPGGGTPGPRPAGDSEMDHGQPPLPPGIAQNRPPMEGMQPPMSYPGDRNRPPMERALQGPRGRWWTDAALVQKLGLTTDQQHRMDAIFQQSRLKLIDLSAALQKEEVTLEPLLQAEHPEESKVVAQIDRIAQARGELEKANARMLLGVRGVLSQDQWKKLQADRQPQWDRRPRE